MSIDYVDVLGEKASSDQILQPIICSKGEKRFGEKLFEMIFDEIRLLVVWTTPQFSICEVGS